ncbi:MAG: hypothetical protein R3A52_07575 [Polyangiales bacterium]
MSDPFAQAYRRGCGAQVVILLLAPLAALALFGVAAAAALAFPAGGVERLAAFTAVVGVGVVGFAAWGFSFAARRTRALDPAFAALGVHGSGSIPNVREFHGVVGGRRLDALYTRRGPQLDLHLATPLHTALAVGPRTGLGTLVRDVFSLTEVPVPDPAFAGLVVSADDPRWAVAALSVPAVRDAVLRAVVDPSGREMRVFALRPGALRLTRRFFEPDRVPAEVGPMVQHLAYAASAFEALPPPGRALPLSPFEARMRAAPGAASGKVVAILVGALLIPLVCGGAVALAAMLSSR